MDNLWKKNTIEEFDATLRPFRFLASRLRPPKGWIHAIRNVLGMSGRQLAQRLGVTRQAIMSLENNEMNDSITIKSMQDIGRALDCQFVYAFVPETSLAEMIKKQATRIAELKLERASQTMTLENQAVNEKQQQKALRAEIERLVSSMPRTLWDE